MKELSAAISIVRSIPFTFLNRDNKAAQIRGPSRLTLGFTPCSLCQFRLATLPVLQAECLQRIGFSSPLNNRRSCGLGRFTRSRDFELMWAIMMDWREVSRRRATSARMARYRTLGKIGLGVSVRSRFAPSIKRLRGENCSHRIPVACER